MVATTKNPLSVWRGVSSPAAGVKATATTTAPSAPQNPASSNQVPYLVVQDITVSMAAGTVAQNPILANLIDGTTGGTNIKWSGYIAPAGTGGAMTVPLTYLNIPCYSGFATLEFAAAGGTLASQSVAMGGYLAGGYSE